MLNESRSPPRNHRQHAQGLNLVERTTHRDREMPPQHPELQRRCLPIFPVCCLWSKAAYGCPLIWRAHVATCCSPAKVSTLVYTPPHSCAMLPIDFEAVPMAEARASDLKTHHPLKSPHLASPPERYTRRPPSPANPD